MKYLILILLMAGLSSAVYGANCVGCLSEGNIHFINITQPTELTLTINSVIRFEVNGMPYSISITSLLKSGTVELSSTPRGGTFTLVPSEYHLIDVPNDNSDGIKVTLNSVDQMGRAKINFELVTDQKLLERLNNTCGPPRTIIETEYVQNNTVCPSQPTCPTCQTCTVCQVCPTTPTTNETTENNNWIPIGIAGGVVVLGILILILIWTIISG